MKHSSLLSRKGPGEPIYVLPFARALFTARLSSDVTRSDEKAGLRRDAVRSQVIDVLEAQIKKETGNEEG
jgi:hypothetical protein